MPRFSAKKIKDLFAKSDAAKTKTAKGKYLEDLAVYLFEMVPGISMIARDKKNTYDTEEIDIALWNEQHARGFKTLNFLILVECKNWSSPVGSMEVNWFLTKIKNRALDFGVLIAAHGNSLRALVKYLDQMSDSEIVELNIPTGIPLVYELDDDLGPIRHYYLGDPGAAAAAAARVAQQTAQGGRGTE